MQRFALSRGLCTQTKLISNRLLGKTAVISASTDGIGFAIAQRLGQEGANIVISSRKTQNVEAALNKLKALGLTQVHGVKCHVGLAEDRSALIKETVEKFGGIDILVSNAAVNPEVGSVLDCSEQAWDKIFDINVKAAFLLAKETLPYLRERKGGSIVFVSSIAGFQPFSLLGAYSVSKTALFGLTKAASQDLASENIRVNCVAPGIVKTKFSSALHETEEATEAALSMIPMRRFGTTDEIAGTVAFLVSDDASYVTGETIVAAGGMASRL